MPSLSESDARAVVEQAFAGSDITDPIVYKGLYLFQVYRPDPIEGDWDPFYSVHSETGKLSEFSVITDGNISEITALYDKQRKLK